MTISFRNDLSRSELVRHDFTLSNGAAGAPSALAVHAPLDVPAASQFNGRALVASEFKITEVKSGELWGNELKAGELRPDLRSDEPRGLEQRLTDIKNGATPRDLPDVKMDQIRELLFGELQRQSEQRLSGLEARVRELETALNHRLDAMQARIDAFAAETSGDRRITLDELARGVADLGERIKRIPRD
jgi:hypothetical protein